MPAKVPAATDSLAQPARPGAVSTVGYDVVHLLISLFGDLLPRAVLERSTKAQFTNAVCTLHTRSFARQWNGAGVDTDLVDPEALRDNWLSDAPHAPTMALLQQAWLAPLAARQGETGTADRERFIWCWRVWRTGVAPASTAVAPGPRGSPHHGRRYGLKSRPLSRLSRSNGTAARRRELVNADVGRGSDVGGRQWYVEEPPARAAVRGERRGERDRLLGTQVEGGSNCQYLWIAVARAARSPPAAVRS